MKNFKADFTRIVEKAKGRVDIVVQKATMYIFSSVILRTPVLTGRARGNWQCAAYDIPQGYNDQIQDKSGSVAIRAMTGVAGTAKAGGIVYLVNNLPYAQRLEYGYSQRQAPNGMVRITVAEFERWLEKAARY